MSTTTTTTTAAQPITADAILRLFPDIDTTSEALSGHDEEQIRLMDEVCIVLDENDMPIGQASKKLCMCCPFAMQSLSQSTSSLHAQIYIKIAVQLLTLVVSRPSHDQYRQGPPSPRLFRLPFQRQE